MTLDAQVQSLKQEVFELEVLNRHIKQENGALKEQSKVDKIIHDNTMLHLGVWQKKNKKLKKKCRKLSRELINLKFRCLIRKPRMVVAPRKKRRGLDVLAEASEHNTIRYFVLFSVSSISEVKSSLLTDKSVVSKNTGRTSLSSYGRCS